MSKMGNETLNSQNGKEALVSIIRHCSLKMEKKQQFL